MMQLAEVGQSLRLTSLSRGTGYSRRIYQGVWRAHACANGRWHAHPEGECILTPLFGGLVIRLAHQPAVLHQVILVTCGQLPFAHDAGEAVEVVDEVLGPPHHLRGRDPLLARRAFGPEPPSETPESTSATMIPSEVCSGV